MKNVSVFQVILLCVFGVFFFVGLVVVAVYSSKEGKTINTQVQITVWGTLDASVVDHVVAEMGSAGVGFKISYAQKSSNTFDSDLAEAIAIGKGPDVVLLRQDSLVSNLLKLEPIPYEIYPVRTFKDSFIEEGELFLSSSGVFALPFIVDPLVMYWNRTIFSQAGLTTPPRFWDELYSLASQLTKLGSNKSIVQSGVAFGSYDNIQNAKEILSALLMQSGNKIVSWDDSLTSVVVTLSRAPTPPDNVLSFYTQFSDIRKSVYSWSRALPDSESMFRSNRLAVYFGFASEAKLLKQKSPNLNFDVAFLPQTRNGKVEGTFGRLYGLAVLRTAKNKAEAFQMVGSLTSSDAIRQVVSVTGLPSVRRDVKVTKTGDPFYPIFAQSALVSRAWLDPKRSESDTIFKSMIDSVLSGFVSPGEAILDAERQLQYLIPR